MGGNPASPWHLWGGSQIVELEQVVAGGSPSTTVQLAKVGYKRPETFAFWLGARLIGGTPVPAGPDEVIFCRFNIYVGVGRTTFITKDPTNQGFVRFLWSVPALVNPGVGNINNTKYTTRVRTPWLEDTDHTTFELIDHVVAEDIQCDAQIGFFSAPVGNVVQVEVTAMFAPWNHIRPDWYTDDPNVDPFKGGELAGS